MSTNDSVFPPGDAAPRRSIGLYVVSALLALSTVVGIIAYWRFTNSETFLTQDLAHMRAVGPDRTVDQCVDEVVGWAATCRAMKSLCDASATRMMEGCLSGQSRREDCVRYGTQTRSTSFGFAECRDRKVDRKTKKACGLAYRSIASHCEKLAQEH